jgi:immune inhibitor A
MFVDDIEITDDGGSIFFDDAETEGNWTSDSQAFVGEPGEGWILTTGTFSVPHYYMAEWRNLDGFDEGLLYAYDSTFLRLDTGEWLVERVPYNAPGMLVWYRNMGYSNNGINNYSQDSPSLGAKGMLLIVDSHFEPLRREPGTGGCALCNLPGRPQSSNSAFNTWGTYPFQEGYEEDDSSIVITQFEAQEPVDAFTDELGWVPGLELRFDLPGVLYFRDQDASVVVPSVGGADYDWRVVWPDGSPATDFWGEGWGSGDPIDGFTPGDYNPSDPNDGVDIGTSIEIHDVADDGSFGIVHIRNDNLKGSNSNGRNTRGRKR